MRITGRDGIGSSHDGALHNSDIAREGRKYKEKNQCGGMWREKIGGKSSTLGCGEDRWAKHFFFKNLFFGCCIPSFVDSGSAPFSELFIQ